MQSKIQNTKGLNPKPGNYIKSKIQNTKGLNPKPGNYIKSSYVYFTLTIYMYIYVYICKRSFYTLLHSKYI